MLRRKLSMALVCLVFLITLGAGSAGAYSIIQAAATQAPEDLLAPAAPQAVSYTEAKAVTGPSLKRIKKVKSDRVWMVAPHDPAFAYGALGKTCCLPVPKNKSWEMNAEVIFARVKGKVRYIRGNTAFGFQQQEHVDLNADMGVPDHWVVPEMTVNYRFRPNWSLRYSIMPMVVNGGGAVGRNFTFGNNNYSSGQHTQVKWERTLHRGGLVYDALRTHRAKVSVFGEYVRLDEKLSVVQVNCCGDTLDNTLNMGMAGLEFERCLKTRRLRDTLSLSCKAGVAFLDEAFGSDLSTGLKYTIPLGNGRYGYLAGGYRYLTFNKGYHDLKRIDTSIEGGYLQMGFIF